MSIMACRSKEEIEEEVSRFHGLPPLKRFKLLQRESRMPERSDTILCLPAKKRIWAVRDFMFEQERALEGAGAPFKVPKCEEMGTIAYKWRKSTKKRSQKAPCKSSESVQEKKKTLEKVEDVPQNVCKVHKLEQSEDQQSQQEEDDGVICNVCSGCDGNSSDPIVFCDGCDLMVHATCYGDPLNRGIPEGDWFCARCIDDEGKALKQACCLCPSSKGAMKCTTQNSWAHISCALLVPEVFFQCPEGRERIDCSRVPARRWGMVCTFCNMAKGACIECSEPRCPSTFHVSCGLDRNLCIEYREGKGGGIVVGFCNVHTLKWEKLQETGKFKIVPREPADCGKRKKNVCTEDNCNDL